MAEITGQQARIKIISAACAKADHERDGLAGEILRGVLRLGAESQRACKQCDQDSSGFFHHLRPRNLNTVSFAFAKFASCGAGAIKAYRLRIEVAWMAFIKAGGIN